MLTWLLSWLFPLTVLMPRARALGSVTFQTVEGVGWQATIRPPLTEVWRRGAINAWCGSGTTLARALRAALVEANAHPKVLFEGDPRHAPKLGGEEFDADE